MGAADLLALCKGAGLVTPAATIACVVVGLGIQAAATKQAESWARKIWKKINPWGKKNETSKSVGPTSPKS